MGDVGAELTINEAGRQRKVMVNEAEWADRGTNCQGRMGADRPRDGDPGDQGPDGASCLVLPLNEPWWLCHVRPLSIW